MSLQEPTAEVGPWVPQDTFGTRLRLVRHHLRLTVEQAAGACDLDDGSWSNWERGVKPRSLDVVVRKVSDVFGVDRDWLMWGGPLRSRCFSVVPVPEDPQMELALFVPAPQLASV